MSAQRMQLGPFFDQGVICPGALLYHYNPGTLTTKNIWSNSGATLELQNPFVSDSNGIFNFFGDGAYDILIERADGVRLYTLPSWKIIDSSQSGLSISFSVPTSSTMQLGDATLGHWTGSINVEQLVGTALFYWATADGNFSLIHSSNLLLPDNRNRKVLSGDVLFFINEIIGGVWRLAGHSQKEGGWTGRQGASVAASATLAVPTDGDFIDVSGATTITAVAAAQAGYRFRARFTGTGLNLTHNATSLISPWGRDYRTIQNEILAFQSLGSGNWIFWSVNGPKERVGTIIDSDSPTAPAGFLARDGTAVSRTTYPGLFVELGSGTIHGAGDGSTTFNVPDQRGRTRVMVDGAANRITSASTNGANADTLGGVGGAQTHTLSISEMPAHDHGYTAVQNTAGAVAAAGGDKGSVSPNTSSTGGGGAHSTTMPWIACNSYIRF